MSRSPTKRPLRSPWLAAALLATALLPAGRAAAGPAAPITESDRPGALVRPVPPAPARPQPADAPKPGPKPSLQKAILERERCQRADYIVGQANSLKDESPLTVKYYERALELCAGHPEANFRLGALAARQRNRERAIKMFRRALRKNPKLADAHYNLGILFRQAKKPGVAQKHFQKAAEINPRDPLALYNLGVLQLKVRDQASALRTFQKALAVAPDMAELHFFVGALLQERGKAREARTALQEALRLKPKLALPRVYLAAILEEEGNSRAAQEELNRVLARNPEALKVGYGFEDFYFREGGANVVLSHLRGRPVKLAALPPAKPKAAKKKGENKKEKFGPRQEAREIPASPAVAPTRKTVRLPRRPAEPKPAPAERPAKKTVRRPPHRPYRVRAGDTLGRIASRYGVRMATLMRLNEDLIEHPSMLEVGQIIRIPKNGARPKPKRALRKKRAVKRPARRRPKAARNRRKARRRYRFHRVRPGDTLAKIARRYKTTIPVLMRLNRSRIEHPYVIEVGQLIRLPDWRPRRARARRR